MRTKSLAQSLPLIAPVHILILSVIVIPSIFVVWLSVTKSSFGQDPTYVGLENYIRVLGDPALPHLRTQTVEVLSPIQVAVDEHTFRVRAGEWVEVRQQVGVRADW